MESVSREDLCGVLMALQRFWPSVSLLPRWGVSSSFSTPNAHTPPVILFLPACPGACPTPTVPHLASSRYSLCHLVRPRAVDTAMCYSASFPGRKGSSPALALSSELPQQEEVISLKITLPPPGSISLLTGSCEGYIDPAFSPQLGTTMKALPGCGLLCVRWGLRWRRISVQFCFLPQLHTRGLPAELSQSLCPRVPSLLQQACKSWTFKSLKLPF